MISAGDIIFVRNNNWFTTNLITFFDKGRFSHVAIAVSDTHVVEAQWGTKVRIIPFYYGQDEYAVVDLGLTQEEREKVSDIALTMTGKWYDYPQLFGYAFKKILGKKNGRNIFNNPNNWICSELVYYMLVSIGKIKQEDTLNDLTPNQLYNFLKNLCQSTDESCTVYDSEGTEKSE
jgi:uncharacterized protein YycO